MNIHFYNNPYDQSLAVKEILIKKFSDRGYTMDRSEEPDYNICIGGDGNFLRAVRDSGFSKAPFIGVNTGTLGFYQEILKEELDDFVDRLVAKDYSISKLNLVSASYQIQGQDHILFALNDFVVKDLKERVLHLDVYLDGFHLQRFAGDGLIISTPTGSTAYNFSVGGAILYQELLGFQLSPLAPISSKAYRSLGNPMVMPQDAILDIVPQGEVKLIQDGLVLDLGLCDKLSFTIGGKYINKLVFDPMWYWESIKDKFL